MNMQQEDHMTEMNGSVQDIQMCRNEPLYPFGYGLSYTNFDISPIRMSGSEVTEDAPLTAQVTVKNTGDCSGTEVVQLYIRDMTASVIRPVKELKGFQKNMACSGGGERGFL